jgi:hypothetical protein
MSRSTSSITLAGLCEFERDRAAKRPAADDSASTAESGKFGDAPLALFRGQCLRLDELSNLGLRASLLPHIGEQPCSPRLVACRSLLDEGDPERSVAEASRVFSFSVRASRR